VIYAFIFSRTHFHFNHLPNKIQEVIHHKPNFSQIKTTISEIKSLKTTIILKLVVLRLVILVAMVYFKIVGMCWRSWNESNHQELRSD
jgi:hypothetical protein